MRVASTSGGSGRCLRSDDHLFGARPAFFDPSILQERKGGYNWHFLFNHDVFPTLSRVKVSKISNDGTARTVGLDFIGIRRRRGRWCQKWHKYSCE